MNVKKDLPPNIRSHFTEIDVPPPDADRETLLSIVEQYIGPSAVSDKAAIMNVAEFYLAVKDLAETCQIVRIITPLEYPCTCSCAYLRIGYRRCLWTSEGSLGRISSGFDDGTECTERPVGHCSGTEMPNRVEERPFRIRDGTHYISQAHMFLILIPVNSSSPMDY